MRLLCLCLLMVGQVHSLFAQESESILRGYVIDAATGQALLGAAVYHAAGERGVLTNDYGFFSLSLPAGDSEIEISYLGYTKLIQRVTLPQPSPVTFELSPGVELTTAEVVELRRRSRTAVPQEVLTREAIRRIPVLLGEADPIKALQLLPGSKYGYEGTASLSVRGGATDQNLFLLDNLPLYNVNHVLGIFSAFNVDAVREVRLIKEGFPARYGGRLSAVIEVNTLEGNSDRLRVNGGVGLIASRLSLEGPLGKKKRSTFLLAGRRTYADLLIGPVQKSSRPDLEDFDAFFYDLNARYQLRIDDRQRIFISGYLSRDRYGEATGEGNLGAGSRSFTSRIDNDWGNSTLSVRYNRLLGERSFLNLTAGYVDYKIDYTAITEQVRDRRIERNGSVFTSGVRDWIGRFSVDWFPAADYQVRVGGIVIQHRFSPGLNRTFSTTDGARAFGRTIDGTETGLYWENDFTTGPWQVNAGVYLGGFATSAGRFFIDPQPRLAVRYQIGERQHLGLTLTRMVQYVGQLTTEAPGFPRDLYVPTADRLPPQRAWQGGLSHEWQFAPQWSLGSAGYYKYFSRVTSLREGTSVLRTNESYLDKVTQGEGWAYGGEWLLRKSGDRLSGWLAYTLAWSNRRFADINGGRTYPYRFDRRHELALVGSYALSKKTRLAWNWVFNTGNPVTVPLTAFRTFVFQDGADNAEPIDVIQYGPRNAFRLRPTHRLDFSITFRKEKIRFTREWIVGVYNVYNRANPYFLEVNTEGVTRGDQRGRRIEVTERSLIPFLPFVTYQFNF